MCLYPKLILNPKYKKTKKNGGNIPPITDQRVKYVPIGCQECMECRKQKSRNWQARLLEDIKEWKYGKFITLTFSNESIKKLNDEIDPILEGYERDNQIATNAVRYFLERWRKRYKRSLRHWLVTELGHNGTENIHLHGIIWTNSVEDIKDIWKYGYVWTGREVKGKTVNYVNEQTVNYIVKYITKKDEIHSTYKSKILTSPGIGNNYTTKGDHKKNKFIGTDTNETYRTRQGYKISLPIYWRNKIYTEKEREQLWLIKLDKQERWICGERIDISQSDQQYYKLLDYYRKQNIRLGYGDDTKNWNKQEYEKQRRNLLLKERIKNASPAGS